MIKDLTKLKWQKNIYYISNDVIFDITSKKKANDLDDCESYIIDIENASDEIKNAEDGQFITLTEKDEPILRKRVPYLKLSFKLNNEFYLIYPLQYLIAEGDVFNAEGTKQSHPNVWDNSYYNVFTQEIIDYIIKNYKETKDYNKIYNLLPAYLTESDIEMTEAYLNSSFLAGQPYDLEKATKGSSEKITFIGIEFVDTDKNQFELNVWNKNYILSVISSYYLQNSINSYQKFLNTAEVYYDSAKISDGVTYLFNKLIQFSNRQTNGELKIFPFNSEGKLNFESVFTNYDTWYEWNKNQ